MVESLMEPEGLAKLAELAAAIPADQTIVEIGTHQAANLVNMARAAKQGSGAHVYGVDPYGAGDIYRDRPHMLERYTPADHQIAQDHIRANHVVRQTTILVGTSVAVADVYAGPQVGLLVIDGEHRYRSVLADFHAWWPHLAPNAVVAFDDYGGRVGAEVANVVDQLWGDLAIDWIEMVGSRMAITRARNA